ncbi:TPA: hypothetical protein ACGFA2_004510 [Serratia marcescens]|uniref:hypothetical protein n=1 Tax=Serratia marcescens TaxID=615 RepID=UPI0036F85642
MKERPYDNRKARIEKKFSTEAMRLLIALEPAAPVQRVVISPTKQRVKKWNCGLRPRRAS